MFIFTHAHTRAHTHIEARIHLYKYIRMLINQDYKMSYNSISVSVKRASNSFSLFVLFDVSRYK